jgi:hypothetical protein
MFRSLFAVEPALASSVRFPALGDTDRPIQKLELALLFVMGVAAAAAALFGQYKLQIPGHAIIRVVFPIALGLALVPRRGAGATMGVVAAGATIAFSGLRLDSTGVGAITSLLLSGVVLDYAASRARSGWPLYAGLASAGLTINVVAFGAKAASKLLGVSGGGPWETWWPRAVVSYPLCGLAAGLVCAIVLFRFRRRDERP